MTLLLLALILAIAAYIVRRLRTEDIALATIAIESSRHSGKVSEMLCPRCGKMGESQFCLECIKSMSD